MKNDDKTFRVVGDTLSIESDYLSECIEYINLNKISNIYICGLFYKLDNLDFLFDCPNVKNININSEYINNIDGLYKINGLKGLIIQDMGCEVDLSKFIKLEDLCCTWNKNYKNIESLKELKSLRLDKYNPKSKNIFELRTFTKLKNLMIVRSTIESLENINYLNGLIKIDLNYLNRLLSIKDIIFLDRLKELKLESCKKIEDIECIGKLKNIEKISIGKCGNINSIKFLSELKTLKSFVCIETKILDNDITACRNLERYVVDNKKEYFY